MQLDALCAADPTPATCRQVIIMISAVPTTCVPKAYHWEQFSQAHLLLSSKPNRTELFLCPLDLHSIPNIMSWVILPLQPEILSHSSIFVPSINFTVRVELRLYIHILSDLG